VTVPGKGQVGEKDLTTNDGISSNKGDDFQIVSQNKEGRQLFGSNCADMGVDFRRCQEERLTCEGEEVSCQHVQDLCDEVAVVSLSILIETIGPPLLGPKVYLDKGKAIQVDNSSEVVDLTLFPLLKGGSSVGSSGSVISFPNPEFCPINRLKDKEVAFLAWQESLSAPPYPREGGISLINQAGPIQKEVEVEFGG
jgi:hypothetical protein